ncbi:MAG: alpha/beta fold hydrolase [Solirubrobacteraceae bacterium]
MPELFCDVGRGITLCYETFGAEGDPPVVLIMGLGTQMIAWPDEFCEQLVDEGFQVIRFDNRDCGRSTHVSGRPPTLKQLLRRRIEPVHYTLSDMAQDTAGLLAELDLAPAHVVGASMGGMIAQTLSAEHPELVRSLVSIMSSTGARRSGQPAVSAYRLLIARPPRDRDAFIDYLIRVSATIGSNGFPRDPDRTRDLAGRSFDRGADAAGTGRQLGAILASGDRTSQLRSISAATLVIHGSRDPMVNRSGGVATARAIPGARLEIVEGMGHDLPQGAWPQLVEAISGHARAADAARGLQPRHADTRDE